MSSWLMLFASCIGKSDVKVEIYDVMGNLIDEVGSKKYEVGMNTIKYDASRLGSGVYFIKVQSSVFEVY